MHPVHFWFIHDLRAYKAALIALAAKVPEAPEQSLGDVKGGVYRPVPVVPKELHTLPEAYLKASGYMWYSDLPYKLQFLYDCHNGCLTERHVEKLKKIPDFAFRSPTTLVKIKKVCTNPFWVILTVCLSPIILAAGAVVLCMTGFEKAYAYLVRSFHWGLAKLLPENLPESRVLGTEKSPRKLPAQITQ